MSILLTAAYDPGDLDAGTYTHVDVTAVTHLPLLKELSMTVEYGTLSGGELAPGKSQPLKYPVRDVDGGTDYTDLEAILSNASEGCIDAYRRALCQWLLDKSHFSGTIV